MTIEQFPDKLKAMELMNKYIKYDDNLMVATVAVELGIGREIIDPEHWLWDTAKTIRSRV